MNHNRPRPAPWPREAQAAAKARSKLRNKVNGDLGSGSWYQIRNEAERATVYVYDEIGFWGVTAQDFVRDLQALRGTAIDLRINSGGGDVFDGIAIFNAVRNHDGEVIVHVDGLAASAASFIAMAGDRVLIARNASLMIHEASGVCLGSAAEMADMAALLDKCSDNIADIYAQKAGGTVAEWRAAMAAETWYSADEAVEAGLADEVDQVEARDAFAPDGFKAAIRQGVETARLAANMQAALRRIGNGK